MPYEIPGNRHVLRAFPGSGKSGLTGFNSWFRRVEKEVRMVMIGVGEWEKSSRVESGLQGPKAPAGVQLLSFVSCMTLGNLLKLAVP